MFNSQIKVIVFDLGNVLIPFDYSVAIDRLNEIEKDLGSRIYEYIKANYHIHRDLEAGKIAEDEFISTCLSLAKVQIDRELFCRIHSEIFNVNEDVAGLLPLLRQNYRLVLLSNTNAIHQKYGWQHYSFLSNFEKLILSHEVGAVKPEKEIYQAVMNYTGEKAESHIFIDDIPEYIEGAVSCGWEGIVFRGYSFLKEELEKRNLL
jgi:putative hydrolase of the HAD superfamily